MNAKQAAVIAWLCIITVFLAWDSLIGRGKEEYHVQVQVPRTEVPTQSPPVVFHLEMARKKRSVAPVVVMSTNVGTGVPGTLQPTDAPTPVDLRSRKVILMVDIPHGGGGTMDCTFGGMRKHVEKMRAAMPVSSDNVEFLTESSHRNVKSAFKKFGLEKGYRHIHPNATAVVTIPFKDPIARYYDAFHAAINGNLESFPCENGFRLPRKADALVNFDKTRLDACEPTRNVYVKKILGLDPWKAVTEEHAKSAIEVIRGKNFTVFLEEEPEKSLHALLHNVDHTLPKNLYFRCNPYPDAPPRLRESLRMKIYTENTFDLALYQEARHVFYTRWASRHEAGYQEGKCASPSLCWEDNGYSHMARRNLKELKSLPINAVKLLAHPVCAETCHLS
eukprot:TRINITY_DN23114_c0_g1_i1.p1 TRINITY_DN23114_c0_g1~~TRINITY_DN23114_c0_g1_i1.p1  ORF type:complete len:391 (+),score=46.98 TRINITY_DN23114_c0_g1_i1:63-1235(+)